MPSLLWVEDFQHLLHFVARLDQQLNLEIARVRVVILIAALKQNRGEVVERDVAALLAVKLGKQRARQLVNRHFILLGLELLEVVDVLG